jgi:hypothetical protein
MRTNYVLYLLICMIALSCRSPSEVTLQVRNPLDAKRNDAIILLSRGEISSWCTVPDNLLPVLTGLDGTAIPCQADDVDGDGRWDELFGLTDLEASGQQTIAVRFTEQDHYPEFPARTNIHLGDARDNYRNLDKASRLDGVSYQNYEGVTSASFQMEGVAWENDRVGFRNYMDQRNGMDIFGKTTTEMVLDSVGKANGPSYHEPGAWGQDILKVGTSLGAGGIGYMYHDSIYRVGDRGSGTFEVVFRGSQRSRFKLDYTGWMVDDQIVHVTHQVEIVAGRHYYQGNVVYEGSNAPLSLVTGIVNMLSDSLHVVRLNDQYTALFTLDHQSEDGTMLAMALMVPAVHLKMTGETRNEGEGVIETYYAVLDASPGELVPYRFYALWEREDPRWASMEEITGYLRTEAARWTQSVVYTGQF